MSDIIILGGTQGIGRALALACAGQGDSVVIAGRDAAKAQAAALDMNAALGEGSGSIRAIAADLSAPHGLRAALGGITTVKHLVIAAIARDQNSLAAYDIENAIQLATLKVVGYSTAVAELKDRFAPGASVLLFGGMAKDRPYPGSTTVTSVNAAIVGMVNTMMHELKPLRFNAIHPGLVGDSPHWAGNQAVLETGRKGALTGVLPTMHDIVDGCLFLMRNQSANGINLSLDGGRA